MMNIKSLALWNWFRKKELKTEEASVWGSFDRVISKILAKKNSIVDEIKKIKIINK